MRLVLFVLLIAAAAHAQQAGTGPPAPSTAGRPLPSTPTAAATPQAHGALLLTIPFDNAGASSSVDWIGAAFPELMNRRFAAAGFLPISRTDRLYALDHLGLPPDFRATRAGTLRLAQSVDADSVVFGTYGVIGDQITATARVLDMTNLREGAPLTETAALSRLPDVINGLAWQVARQLDGAYSAPEQTFLTADSSLRLDAFEDYIRGLVQGAPEERVRRLRDAVRLDPGYGPAWLALGDAEFAAQDYEQAALAYGHLSRSDPDALHADFSRGLAYFYSGKYLPAEDAFAFVSTRLPLPEVVNNQGVAAARRGKDGAPSFQQAIAGDPQDADYHWNLALAYAHRGDAVSTGKELAAALQLKPTDAEMQGMAANLRSPGWLGANSANLPLERIKRSYDEAAFRQAAFELEQMEALRGATEPPAKRTATLVADANTHLNSGLLVESEREYNRALLANPNSAEAYVGLARVRERTADWDAARSLAQKSLALHDNAPAHLVLARLDLQAGEVPAAQTEIAAALRLDGNNAEARGLQQSLQARVGQTQ